MPQGMLAIKDTLNLVLALPCLRQLKEVGQGSPVPWGITRIHEQVLEQHLLPIYFIKRELINVQERMN